MSDTGKNVDRNLLDQPILIIDDDTDDNEILLEAWKALEFGNELLFFNSSQAVLNYLKLPDASPFIIFCDVNMPSIDGFQLREAIIQDSSLRHKSVPFIFWSTVASKEQIQKAYDLGVQGFFIKENSFAEIKQSLIDIVKYWKKSKSPKL